MSIQVILVVVGLLAAFGGFLMAFADYMRTVPQGAPVAETFFFGGLVSFFVGAVWLVVDLIRWLL